MFSFNWVISLKNWLTPGTAPDSSFVEWKIPGEVPLSPKLKLHPFTKLGNIRGLTPEEQQKSFYKTINEQLDAGGISLVEIDIALNVAIPEAVISLENPSINHPIGQLTIRDTGIYVLKNLNIENLALPTRSKDSKIFISNCNINHIHCSDSNYPFLSLYISDSVVSKFEADGNTIQHLEVRGGSILNFICPGPGEQNPFMGDVIFDNVFFPRTAKIYPIKGPQAYKNVRHHLRSNNNELSANEIHSAELSLEREFDTSFFNKFASILYELISDFGKATFRPLLWFILMFELSVLFIINNGGALLDLGKKCAGWQCNAISLQGYEGEVYRAITLTGQQILNPVGILGKKGLTIASNNWVLGCNILFSIMSVILIALFIFAIRRRFKLQ